MWHQDSEVLIICFSKQQAQLYGKVRTLQVDLTFKRVHGCINELTTVAWHSGAQKGK